METQQNNISSQAMLSAIVGMMFFAPLIKNNLNKESDFSQEEKDFIMGYVNVGFFNLSLLIIVLISTLINIFWIYPILSRITTIGSLIIYIVTIFSLFACINSLTMRKSDEKLIVNIQHKGQLLKAYIPILNFIQWYRQDNYNMPYRWLKESILLWNIFIFGTSLLGNIFGIGALIVIAVRVILLLLNVDIIPLSLKKAINSLFLCNPGEIFAYIFSSIISNIKHVDYETVLQARKQNYAQGQNFGIGIIIQYLGFIAILYFIYYNSFSISWIRIILLLAAILWISKIGIFYRYKKTFPRIPILSEITSLVFH